MELRHLRYFVAVAEAGSLKVAAEQRLHTTQPSLSRQIHDLEEEIGEVTYAYFSWNYLDPSRPRILRPCSRGAVAG
jgi:ABC-type arginine transport system ATPase subunit